MNEEIARTRFASKRLTVGLKSGVEERAENSLSRVVCLSFFAYDRIFNGRKHGVLPVKQEGQVKDKPVTRQVGYIFAHFGIGALYEV